MKANQACYRVAMMCRVLDVSRSGYYAWLKREPSARVKANAELLETIREIHAESDGTYGAPRVHAELVERPQGPKASLNRVARVMNWAGLQGVSPRKWACTTVRDETAFRHIEGWYNPKRRHSSLGYQSPANFEAKNRTEAA